MITEKPRGGRRKRPYPEVWKSGPDPRRHDQYTAWQRHRSQARFRGESHSIDFETWVSLWEVDDLWSRRGRHRESVCLTQIDLELGWHIDNVTIIPRIEQLKINGFNLRHRL